MFFNPAGSLRPKAELTSESEVIELRIVGGFYTYFGWFPWSDFEGESLSEDRIYELTGGRSSGVASLDTELPLSEPIPRSKF